MKRLTLAAAFILLGMALLLTVSSPAQAIMVPLTMEDLTREADAIVIGTITEVTIGYDSNHAGIYTSVFIDVDEGLKGNVAPGAKIAISIEGGTIGSVTEWVEDQPIFTASDAGRQILVFLSKLTLARSNQIAASLQNSNYPIFQICGCFEGLATADDKFEINNILKRITPGKPTASAILSISEDSRLMNHGGSYIPDNEYNPRQPANADVITVTANDFWRNPALYFAILVLLGALVAGLLIIRRRN
ncbi:MAG: hypothetical protein ABSF74_03430 [Dehalococcoidia bacterium]|jgi:hypothetical protein